jgi:4-amino-4-deoxy-L-arabinose transferase-like glycosyltransferase
MNKLLFVLVVLFVITAFLLYYHFVPDDAFIHIGYAKDILSGKGYSFAGNKTYGSTAPLWPPLIAATGIVLRNLEMSARLLSLVFGAASILMMFYTARLRFDPLESFVAAFLLTANTYFLRWLLTGMEASAAVFFMILLAFIFYEENDRPAKRPLYFLLGFAPLIRPEFYLILFIFFAYLMLKRRRNFDFAKLVLSIVPILVWLCFAEAYYGTIIPTTYLVKAGGQPFFSIEFSTLVRDTKSLFSESFVEIGFIFIALILFFVSIRDFRLIAANVLRSESFLFVILLVSFFCFYELKNVIIISRYSLMLVPLFILVTIDCISHAAHRWKFSGQRRHFVWIALITASTLYNSIFTAFVVKPDADRFYEGFQKQYMEIAAMLRKLNTGSCHVALSDVGMIGVYSGCYIDDLDGLVDKDRLKYKSREDYLRAKKPEFLILHGEMDLRNIDTSFREIYTTTLPPFGINGIQDVKVCVYQAR